MSALDAFYDINPVAQIDQNKWDEKIAELVVQFRTMPIVYTNLIDWTDESQMNNGAQKTIHTEMLEGDTDIDEIPFNANYIGVTTGVDSRSRTLSSTRYGDKVQLHESQNLFQQWKFNGTRDWRPLLRSVLGQNIIRKHEMLSRNAYLKGPKSHWTYAGTGATNFAQITSSHTFAPDILNAWNLRLGNTGTPVIPGDQAGAKLCIIPPGCIYDFQQKLATATQNEASMWRDAQIYAGQAIRYEIGAMKNVRFQVVPNNNYGENMAVLYNAGVITGQYGVSLPIHLGDGAPDPEISTALVDDVWAVGQKNVVHYVQLEADADMADFSLGDMVTIHTKRTDHYGVTNGVDITSGKTIVRRVVAIDNDNHRLSFDRPILFKYEAPFVATSNDGIAGTYYAFVTKGRHVGMCLVLGSRGGIMGKIDRPIKFYEPKPVDDFESVWRFVWDAFEGYNLWDPNLFEVHFCAVTLPKPGGIIAP
jgi:hypothetical protein